MPDGSADDDVQSGCSAKGEPGRGVREGELWVFDMDGTLFDPSAAAVPAFQRTIRELGESGIPVPPRIGKEEVESIFGYTHDRIWETLLGHRLTPQQQEFADRLLLEAERLELKTRGSLYPGVVETLRTLNETGATLAVASNAGAQSYLETIVERFGIHDLFSGRLYSAGGYGAASKVHLVARVLEDWPHRTAFMVGDRGTDIEAGSVHGIHTVACVYGYSSVEELSGARWTVNSFPEILRLSDAAKA